MNEKEVEQLRKEIQQLKKELEKVKREKQEIEDQKKRIEDEKKRIEKEFEEFKLKHCGTVNELKKAMHLKPNLSVRKKALGAQKGHKGYTRKIPERIDLIISLNPKRCPDCGQRLKGDTQETRERYLTDITFVAQIKNTKYERHRKYCTGCKKLVELPVPNSLPHARFGLNLMLLVMYLRVSLRLPVEKIVDFLNTMYNLRVSKGEIILIGYQLARAFGPYYTHLEQLLKLAKVKHSDTTSWRTEAKNYTAWVFIATGVVLYKITRRGNAKIPIKLFGKKQHGNILVVDRHSVFRSLAAKLGFTLQMCWSHILQDSKELARDFGREGSYVHRKIKHLFADAKSLEHEGTEAQVQKLKARVIALAQKKYAHSTVRKWVKNLAKRDIESLFIFVTNPDVDPTNNISERELRTLVVFRNITNGSRSEKGSKTTATLFSIVQTLKLKNQNILTGLQEILNQPSGS